MPPAIERLDQFLRRVGLRLAALTVLPARVGNETRPEFDGFVVATRPDQFAERGEVFFRGPRGRQRLRADEQEQQQGHGARPGRGGSVRHAGNCQ